MIKDPRMLQKLMQQAQKAQKELSEKLNQFDNQIFTHTFGADHVYIEITGNLTITKLVINKELWKDPEMATEIITDAINEAIQKVTQSRTELQNSLVPKNLGF